MAGRSQVSGGRNPVADGTAMPAAGIDGPCCPPVTEVPLSAAEAQAMAVRFAALGEPVRLRLLSMVAAGGEVCSCNLESPLGRSQPTISHHTRVLAEAGLIVGEKRGRWTWWQVAPGLEDLVRQLLSGA